MGPERNCACRTRSPPRQHLIDRTDHYHAGEIPFGVLYSPCPIPDLVVRPTDTVLIRQPMALVVVDEQIARYRQPDRRCGLTQPFLDDGLDAPVDLDRRSAGRQREVEPVHFTCLKQAQKVNEGSFGLAGAGFCFEHGHLTGPRQRSVQQCRLRRSRHGMSRKERSEVHGTSHGRVTRQRRVEPPPAHHTCCLLARPRDASRAGRRASAPEAEHRFVGSNPIGQRHEAGERMLETGRGWQLSRVRRLERGREHFDHCSRQRLQSTERVIAVAPAPQTRVERRRIRQAAMMSEDDGPEIAFGLPVIEPGSPSCRREGFAKLATQRAMGFEDMTPADDAPQRSDVARIWLLTT